MSLPTRIEHALSVLERFFSLRNVFLFGSLLAGVVCTYLFYRGVLPLSVEYFLFYSFVLFLACLARPSWMFLFFIAVLPLEIVSVMPSNLGLDLRPYQWVGALLGLALGVRLVSGRLRLSFFRWHPVDVFLSIIVSGIAVSGFFSQGIALKQTVVIVSFLFLYFLSRLFLREWRDVQLAWLFFHLSGSLVLLWGIGQNILFLFWGQGEYSIMPGRPNGTLIEPDWLGLFLLFLLTPVLGWLKQGLDKRSSLKTLLLPALFLIGIFTALILTVSRSAWLGALVVCGSFLFFAFSKRGKELAVRPALSFLQWVIVAFGIALVLVEGIPLTRFALIDRAGSTVSHLQEITLACDGRFSPPQTIQSIDELAQYGCQHIPLEEKAARQAEGQTLATTYRPDPNVNIRKMIFSTAWNEIKAHPFLGIGWGNIGTKLGVDERGASYNASNIFLEVWLGGGLLSLFGFVGFLAWVGYRFLKEWWKSPEDFTLQALFVSLLLGFLVFNLFNTGLLLGFVWVWLALFPLVFPYVTQKQNP